MGRRGGRRRRRGRVGREGGGIRGKRQCGDADDRKEPEDVKIRGMELI